MKSKEFVKTCRDKDIAALTQAIEEMQKELFHTRDRFVMEKQLEKKTKKASELQTMRKNIARMYTILSQKKSSEIKGAK